MANLLNRLKVLQDTGNCCQNLEQQADALEDHPLREQYNILGDKNRFKIAQLTKANPGICGCELQYALNIGHATVSHHMAKLTAASLVSSWKDGKWTRYQTTDIANQLLP